jgi:hypothetical protein
MSKKTESYQVEDEPAFGLPIRKTRLRWKSATTAQTTMSRIDMYSVAKLMQIRR